MHGQAPSLTQRLSARLLGQDRPEDLLAVVGLFAIFVTVDRWSQGLASLTRAGVTGPTLVLAAVGARWWLFIPLVALAAVGFRFQPARLGCRWADLQHGLALRRLAMVLVAVLTWHGTLYDVNYLAGQTHGADRVLLVVLAVAAWFRPLPLIGFVIQFRIINQQFVVPFDTSASVDVDELLVLALVAIVAVHLRYVVTGRRETAPVLLVISAALAAHFFASGWGHLRLDWYTTDELSNLPLGGYTAGWLRYGDGGGARFLAQAYDVFGRPVLLAVGAIELGAAVALLRRRLMLAWLLAAMAFHVLVFVTTGFWVLAWIVLEAALFRTLWAPSLSDWHAANRTGARLAVTVVAATLGAPLLFHPPALARLDSPVSYGYEVEAIGASGTLYHVPNDAFAPYDVELALTRLQLGATQLASGPYGTVGSREQLDTLRAITSFEELAAHEATLGPPTLTVQSQELVRRFMEQVNDGRRRSWFGLGPPPRTWASRGEPTYDDDEPLTRLEVWLIRAIHAGDGEQTTERELVLALELDQGNQVVVASGQWARAAGSPPPPAAPGGQPAPYRAGDSLAPRGA